MLSRKPGALLVAFVLTLLLGHGRALAAPSQPFTLQPSGKATITFEAFCVNFGKLFPTAITGPDGTVAPDKVRAALEYALDKGLTADSQQALQVQYAIWQLINTPNSPKGDALAQDIITAANAASVTNPAGTSILDAAKASQVTITLDSWQPIGDKQQITATASDHFYGRGQITVENVSQQALTLYMPTGTVFPPASNAQNMAGIQTDIVINNPNLPATGGNTETPLTVVLVGGLLLVAGGWLLRRRIPAFRTRM
jgi:LPXTG-motif cell wall-anchored protein